MVAMRTEASSEIAVDGLSLADMVTTLIDAQSSAIEAVRMASQSIQSAIEAATERLGNSTARLIYCGAGTSGRIGLLDGVELAPTFGWPDERMVTLMAGGDGSLVHAVEGAEDDRDAALRDAEAAGVTENDVVVALAASGSTPYTIEVLKEADRRGALTIGVSNNPDAPMFAACSVTVLLDTGAEVVAGSTRLAAGTSQKAFLNTFSTGVMVRLGRVHNGLMVDMEVTNTKLRRRAVGIVRDLAGVDGPTAERALEEAEFSIKEAALIAQGVDRMRASRALDRARGVYADAQRWLGESV